MAKFWWDKIKNIEDTISTKLIKLKQNTIRFWEQYNLKTKCDMKYIKNVVSNISITWFIFSNLEDVSGNVYVDII